MANESYLCTGSGARTQVLPGYQKAGAKQQGEIVYRIRARHSGDPNLVVGRALQIGFLENLLYVFRLCNTPGGRDGFVSRVRPEERGGHTGPKRTDNCQKVVWYIGACTRSELEAPHQRRQRQFDTHTLWQGTRVQ